MNFEIDGEGVELVSAIADVFDRRDDARAIAEASLSGNAVSASRWAALCELGLPALRLPEPAGIGADLLTAVAVAERLGATLIPEPAVSAIVLVPLLTASATGAGVADGLCSGEQAAALARSGTVELSGSGAISGRVLAPDDGLTTMVAVLAHDPLTGASAAGLFDLGGIPAGGRLETDPTRPWIEVDLDLSKPFELIPLPTAAAVQAHQEFAVLSVSELVGGMQKVLDDTIRYVTDREQFGRSIGSFQAVKHQLADVYVLTEQARAAAQFAAIAIAADEGEAAVAVDAAARWVPRAAINVFEAAIHLHGAMGYSWELDIHLHLRRALVTRQVLAAARPDFAEISR